LRKRLRKRPPIPNADPRDELADYGKAENFAPGWLLAKCSWSNSAISEIIWPLVSFLSPVFPENVFYIKILFFRQSNAHYSSRTS